MSMAAVVGVDERVDGAFENIGVREVAATQAQPLQDAEPDLNLGQPTGVKGQEVELDPSRLSSGPIIDCCPAGWQDAGGGLGPARADRRAAAGRDASHTPLDRTWTYDTD